MSITEFGVALGIYSPAFVETDRYIDSLSHGTTSRARQFWKSHAKVDSRNNYQPTKSKSTSLTSPMLRVLHRLIAHTICGRRESTGVVTVRDIFYLSCLWSQLDCNLGYGFATYFDAMSNKSRGALCGGSYVTRLVQNLGVFRTLTGLTRCGHMLEIAMDTYRLRHLVEKRGDVYVLRGDDAPAEGRARAEIA